MANEIPKEIHEMYMGFDLNGDIESRVAQYAKKLIGIQYGSDAMVLDDQEKKYGVESYLYEKFTMAELHFSFEKLDCVTYVETVLALAHIPVEPKIDTIEAFTQAFINNLKAIRYMRGQDNFWERNHFMSRDWNNFNNDLYPEINHNVLEKPEKVCTARTEIDKIKWFIKTRFLKQYRHYTLQEADEIVKGQIANTCYPDKPVTVDINYIKLPDAIELANDLDKWPTVSIVEIVRPNWDLVKASGTHLHVSHVGFCIKENETLRFYHASTMGDKKVVSELISEYMQRYIFSPTIKGINIRGIKDNMDAHLKNQQASLQGNMLFFSTIGEKPMLVADQHTENNQLNKKVRAKLG